MTPESRPPYIEFQDVEVRYTPHVHGLRGINLVIRRGDFVFFVGKTGAGKSTLLKLLSREVKHDTGLVRFHGRDLSEVRERDVPELRREMGIVPQDFALLPRKRVWENVAYAMRAVGNTRRTVRRRVPEILERVNVGHRADAYPHELSGGEQQRVAIGRALINNPPLILADEPTGNLDPEHSWEIMELLRSLNARGATVLVATHDMTVVERMARRIVTLEGGRIVSDTAPNGVLLGHPHQHELDLIHDHETLAGPFSPSGSRIISLPSGTCSLPETASEQPSDLPSDTLATNLEAVAGKISEGHEAQPLTTELSIEVPIYTRPENSNPTEPVSTSKDSQGSEPPSEPEMGVPFEALTTESSTEAVPTEPLSNETLPNETVADETLTNVAKSKPEAKGV